MAQQGTRGTNGKPSPLTLEQRGQRFRLLRRCYMDRVKVYIGLVIPVFAVRFIMCTVQAVRDLFDAAEILRCVFGVFPQVIYQPNHLCCAVCETIHDILAVLVSHPLRFTGHFYPPFCNKKRAPGNCRMLLSYEWARRRGLCPCAFAHYIW